MPTVSPAAYRLGITTPLAFMTSALGDTFNPPKVKVLDAMIGKHPNGGSVIGRAQLDFVGRSASVHWRSNLLVSQGPDGHARLKSVIVASSLSGDIPILVANSRNDGASIAGCSERTMTRQLGVY